MTITTLCIIIWRLSLLAAPHGGGGGGGSIGLNAVAPMSGGGSSAAAAGVQGRSLLFDSRSLLPGCALAPASGGGPWPGALLAHYVCGGVPVASLFANGSAVWAANGTAVGRDQLPALFPALQGAGAGLVQLLVEAVAAAVAAR